MRTWLALVVFLLNVAAIGGCDTSPSERRSHHVAMIRDIFSPIRATPNQALIDRASIQLREVLQHAKREGIEFSGPEILSLVMGVNGGNPSITMTCRSAYRWDGIAVCPIDESEWQKRITDCIKLFSSLQSSDDASEMCIRNGNEERARLSAFCSEELTNPASSINKCRPAIEEYKAVILPQYLGVLNRTCANPLSPIAPCG